MWRKNIRKNKPLLDWNVCVWAKGFGSFFALRIENKQRCESNNPSWCIFHWSPPNDARLQIFSTNSHSNNSTSRCLAQCRSLGRDGRRRLIVRRLQGDEAGLQLNYVHTPPDTSVCCRSTATCRQFPLWPSCLLPVSSWEQSAACSPPSSPSALFLSLCPRRPFSSVGKTSRFTDLKTATDLAGCSESQRARLCVSLTPGAKRGGSWEEQSARADHFKWRSKWFASCSGSRQKLIVDVKAYFLFALSLFFRTNAKSL